LLNNKRSRGMKTIDNVKNKIGKVIPMAKNIKIQVERTIDGGYQSLIKVQIPKRKSLVAIKKDDSFWGSIEKSKHAVLKQFQKLNRRHRPQRILVYNT
jgi:isocitrate lyase